MMTMSALMIVSCSQQPKEINNDGVYKIVQNNRTIITLDTDQSVRIIVYNDLVCFHNQGYEYYTCTPDAEAVKRD